MRLLFSFCFILISSFASLQAHAYECWGWQPTDILDAYDNADAVFTGSIVSQEVTTRTNTTIGNQLKHITFKANKVWKGLDDEEMILNDDPTFTVEVDSIYRYDFKIQRPYLILAYKIHNDDRLSLVGCPRSVHIDNAMHEIKMLPKPMYPLIEEIISKEERVQFDETLPILEHVEIAPSDDEEIEIIEEELPLEELPDIAPPPSEEDNPTADTPKEGTKALDEVENKAVISDSNKGTQTQDTNAGDHSPQSDNNLTADDLNVIEDEELPLLPDL